MLSVIIITKNEERNIEECLKSVQWADEVVILDSGSTDKTEEISRKFTDNFFINSDWQGFGIQKQRALELSNGEWVLLVDADERITEELKQEILTVVSNHNLDGYLIPRSSIYLGKGINYSGWYPDYTLRLAKRKKVEFSSDLVHEKMLFDSKPGKLINPIIHYPYNNLAHHFEKINSYSSLSAEAMFHKGKDISLIGILIKCFAGFIRTYIIKRGFLDGSRGLIIAITTFVSVFQKYTKLWELNRKQK